MSDDYLLCSRMWTTMGLTCGRIVLSVIRLMKCLIISKDMCCIYVECLRYILGSWWGQEEEEEEEEDRDGLKGQKDRVINLIPRIGQIANSFHMQE